MLFTLVYFNIGISPALGGVASEVYGVDRVLYGSGVAWGCFFLVPVFCLLRDYTWRAFHELHRPTDEDTVRQQERYGAVLPGGIEEGRPLPGVQARTTGGNSDYTGYAFSANESTASVPQAEIVRRYDTTLDRPDG